MVIYDLFVHGRLNSVESMGRILFRVEGSFCMIKRKYLTKRKQVLAMKRIFGILLMMAIVTAVCQTAEKQGTKTVEQLTEDSQAAQQPEQTKMEKIKETEKTKAIEGIEKTRAADSTEKSGEAEMPRVIIPNVLPEGYVPLPDIHPEKVREKRLEAGQAANNGLIFADTAVYRELVKNQEIEALAADESGNYIAAQKADGPEAELWLVKYDPTGSVITKQSGGSQGWVDISRLQYHQDLGIMICGMQADGRKFLACLNQDSLTPRWIYPVWGEVDACYPTGQAVVAALEASAEQKTRIIKLNSEGQELWRSEALGWRPEVNVTELSDGRVIAVQNAREKDKAAVMIYSYAAADGEKLSEILADYYGELTPTDDGGFIMTGFRPIKAVPQPVVISAIWFDVETVATKYDKKLTIEWRKTYDSFKDTIGRDIIIPRPDGSIILTTKDTPF